MPSKGLSIALAQWLVVSGLSGAPKLKIVILEGEGAVNDTRQRTAREPIVEVHDENNQPAAGATVLFTLPDHGASGTFANGARNMTVSTDAQGRAAATGLHPNSVAGKMKIRVNASYQGQTGNATITQTNVSGGVAAAGGGSRVLLIVAALGGVAAGVVIFLATRGPKAPTTTCRSLPDGLFCR